MANITGTDTNDNLTGTADADVISGLAGNDKITGGAGADTLIGGDGDDEFLSGGTDLVAGENIDGGSGTNQISVFGSANLSVISLSNIQTLNIHRAFIPSTPEEFAAYVPPTVMLTEQQFASLNRIWVVSGLATINAANAGLYSFADKTVAGGTGYTFIGSSGNDTFIGNNLKQVIIGGLGADTLTGNDGSDLFTYTAKNQSTAAQTDIITDFFKGVDKFDLTGLNFLGVTTGTPAPGWLKLTYDAGLNVTTLADLGGSGFTVKLNGNHLALDNTDFIGLGSIITGTSGNDYLPGTSDADQISGLDGNDVLQGLGGADTQLGGNGDDEFLVGFDETIGDVIDGGAGQNKISSWNADLSQALISNVDTLIANLDRVTLTASQFAVFSNIITYGNTPVTIHAATSGNYSFSGKAMSGAFNLTGSNGLDILVGNSKGQILDGGDGNDVIQGLGGADTALGRNGDDEFLVGFDEAIGETIDGGSGNNKISSWNADLSQATIRNVQTLITNLERVRLTAAQFADLTTISNYSSGSVAIQAATAGAYNLVGKSVLGVFDFVGSAGDDALIGNASAQKLAGGLGADTLTGGAGADIFTYQSTTESSTTKADVITDFIEGSDKIDLTGLGFNSLTTGTALAGQLKVSYDSALNRTTITDTHGTNFSLILNGNHLGISDTDFVGLSSIINGTNGDDYLVGTAQQDVISGLDGNDRIQGLGREDTLLGGKGNDEFLVGFNEAVGDTIDGEEGYNFISSWNADLSQTTIRNVQALITNLDKVVLTAQQLVSFVSIFNYGSLPVAIQAASAGAYDFAFSTLYGSFNFVGSRGNDTIRGGSGILALHGGDGDDVLRTSRIGGVDLLYGDAGDDTFQVESYPAIPLPGTVLDGGTGNNAISGDFLQLYDFTIRNVQTLDIRNSAVLTAEQFSNFTNFSGFGHLYGAFAGTYDMSAKVDMGSVLVLFDGSGGDDIIIGHARNQSINGNDGNDTIYGGDGNDVIYGGNGRDTLYGGDVGDILQGEVIYGEGGDDIMHAEGNNFDPTSNDNYFDGGDGNDLFDGRGGNDTLIGGTGNDSYYFSGGQSTITDVDSTVGNSDVVSFSWTADRDQIWFTRSSNDLVAQIIGTSDQVTISGWYLGSDHHVEQFVSREGYTLLDTQVQNLVNAMAGFAVPSTTTLSAEYHAALDPVLAANWT